VGSRLHGQGRGLGGRGLVLVEAVDVGNRTAIADHEAVESPLLVKLFLKQVRVSAGRDAVHALVGAHHGVGFAFHDAGLEGGQVRLLQVVGAGLHVEAVARGLGAAVYSIVLGGGDLLEVMRVGALQAFDEGDRDPAGEVGIFAVGLLSATPSR